MPRARKLPPGLWKRGSTYYARFNHGGRMIRKRLSTDFDVAKEALNQLRARADRGDFNLIDNDYKWEELKNEFLRWAKQSVLGHETYARDLGNFEKYLKVVSLKQITPAYVVGYREWRQSQTIRQIANAKVSVAKAKCVCPRTVNREVATLNNMLNKGVEWGYIGMNAIAGVKPLRHTSPRKQRRALSLAEVERLLAASPDYLRPVFRLYASSGIRRDELVSLQFSDIDFKGRTITIRASVAKNGKAREIPLDDEMLSMLAELRDTAKSRQPMPGVTAEHSAKQAASFSRGHVFVTQANTPLKNNLLARFYSICKRAGIEGAQSGGSVDIHSLRGTYATLAMAGGAAPKDVQTILGHSTLALTMKTYTKATEQGKRTAVEAVGLGKVSPPDHILSLSRSRTEIVTATENQSFASKNTGFQTGT